MPDQPSGLPGSNEAARWFASDLHVCPQCGEHGVLPRMPGERDTPRVCMKCGPLAEEVEAQT